MGRVVSIFDNNKYLEKNDKKVLLAQNIINDISSDISDIISGLSSFIDIISYHDGDDKNILCINDKIKDLKEFKKEINDLDFSLYDIDNLLYRLHIMLEISHKEFLYRFKNNFNRTDFNEVILFHTVAMVGIYINGMNNTLKSNYLCYDYGDDIEGIKEFVNDSCHDAYINAKKKVYNLSLYDLVFRAFPNDTLSNEEKEYLDFLISDTVDTFINYHYVDIRNYFFDILFSITDGNMFRLNMVDLSKNNKKKIQKKIKSLKLYYATREVVDREIESPFLKKFVSSDNRMRIEECFYTIKDQVKKDNYELNSFIKKTIGKLSSKINHLITETIMEDGKFLPLLSDYYTDDLEMNRFIMFINAFKDKVINYDSDKEFDFNKEWNNAKSKLILDKLYDVIRREIFSGEDKEFYSNEKYKQKLNEMIQYISINPNYINTIRNNSKLVPDFNIALNLLKGAMILEDKAKSLGLDFILEDINNLDYRDYDYVSNYIVGLNDIIDSSNIMDNYNSMKKELSKKRRK